jgi:hypothetical protein
MLRGKFSHRPRIRPAAAARAKRHAGSALELARLWDLPVHMHPGELPLASGRYLPENGNPLDRADRLIWAA